MHLLEDLLLKFERALLRSPLDVTYLEFVCRQQLYLLQALSRHVEISHEIIQALQEVIELVRQPSYSTASHAVVDSTVGLRGRPRFAIEREELVEMLQTNLPVHHIAKMMGVSTRTIFRRMNDFGLSVSGLYSSIADEELDNAVRAIKDDMPAAGLGICVQWPRISAIRKKKLLSFCLANRYNIIIFDGVDGYSRKVCFHICFCKNTGCTMFFFVCLT